MLSRAGEPAPRYFMVEAATGRIWPVYKVHEDNTHAALADAARRLDAMLGRFGRRHVGHSRNPQPGQLGGYYVYESASQRPEDIEADAQVVSGEPQDALDAGVRNWVFVGFVEVVPNALVDRVWLEKQDEGFIVLSTAENPMLTLAPVPLPEAERIAIDFATRTGAHYDDAGTRRLR
jgi:hypothetical protein